MREAAPGHVGVGALAQRDQRRAPLAAAQLEGRFGVAGVQLVGGAQQGCAAARAFGAVEQGSALRGQRHAPGWGGS